MTARAGRADISAMLKVSSVPSDEPVFFLRAQDQVAADTVRAWAALYFAAGGEPAVAEQALEQADRMDAWPTKKLPDGEHLTPGQQKRLAWGLERRAWGDRHSAPEVPTAAQLLTEQRGYTAGKARASAEVSSIKAAALEIAIHLGLALEDASLRALLEQRAANSPGAPRLDDLLVELRRALGMPDRPAQAVALPGTPEAAGPPATVPSQLATEEASQ